MWHSTLLATLAGLLLAVPVGHAVAAPADRCAAHANASLDALVRGDYASARQHFSATTAQAVDVAKLEQVWAQIQAQVGAYQKHAASKRQSLGGQVAVVTPVSFSRMPLNFVVACDGRDQITTFRFAPAEAAAPATPSEPSPVAHTEANGVRVQPLQVDSPLGPLPGVLTLPAGDGPFPAVVLVAGSGPHDHDETIGPNKPFRDLAQGLAATGIASLRYDKRSYTYGMQMAGQAITVDDEVTDDALTALRLLGRQDQIDPQRLFVLGHSLGALMAPRIGQRDPQLAGLILLAAPVRLDMDTVLRQLDYLGRQQGLLAAELEQQAAPIRAARDVLAAADPAHPPAGQFLGAPAAYWLSLRDYDPIDVAQKVAMPLLILQGGSDYQVTPEDDYARWQAAFAGSARVQLREYPGLSHLFMPAGQPPSPADYAKPGHLDAHVVDDIGGWIKAQPPRG